MSNKLFVIGGENNYGMEVFDSMNRKFSYIKNEIFSSFLKYNKKTGGCCVGNKIVLVGVSYEEEHEFVIYETKNN